MKNVRPKDDLRVWVFQSIFDCFVSPFLHVGSQTHPLDVGSHGSWLEEPVIDFIHLFDCPAIWVGEGRMSVRIDAGCITAMALH